MNYFDEQNVKSAFDRLKENAALREKIIGYTKDFDAVFRLWNITNILGYFF